MHKSVGSAETEKQHPLRVEQSKKTKILAGIDALITVHGAGIVA